MRQSNLSSLTCRYQYVNGLLVRIFTSNSEISSLNGLPVLGGDLLPEIVEALHGILQFLPQAVDYRSPSPIRRGTRAATGEAPIGGIGAIKSLQSDLNEFGLLESKRNIGIHTRSEVFDSLSIVKRLALFMGVMEFAAESIKLLELIFNGFNIFKELVEINSSGGRGGVAHLNDMAVAGERARREQIVHWQPFEFLLQPKRNPRRRMENWVSSKTGELKNPEEELKDYMRKAGIWVKWTTNRGI